MVLHDTILEMAGITKRFPGVTALDDVSMDLRRGEIHALMGENGAGKSTFIKVITGVFLPDEGTIQIDGEPVALSSPLDAQERGIAAIYQHVTCYPDLSVTENIFIGHERKKGLGRIDWSSMHVTAGELLQRLGADFSPRETMGSLSVAQQQMVEIAKALSMDARILIMDEPTAALTKQESEQLYRISEQLRDEGKSILFISHRFEDMWRLADRVTVLRDAKYIGTWDIGEVDNDTLIMAMVGREISNLFPTRHSKIGKELFRAENLSCTGLFADISFAVHEGEIVSLTGLVGAGRTEVCQAIYGIGPPSSGRIFLHGEEKKVGEPHAAMEQGIAYLPEDRQKQGLILPWQIWRNITLSVFEKIARRGWLHTKAEAAAAQKLFDQLGVRATGIDALASSLSGGNQQKVVVAKILATDLKFIILDEPTKGVDVGAKHAMYEIINALAEQGYGILLVSSEMPEVIAMSDRILVMKEGRITGELTRETATQEKILGFAMSSGPQKGATAHE